MRYSYDNKSPERKYHKKIREGFKRFHSMNAQERVMCVEHLTVLQFVSYDTLIMQVTIDHKHNTITVACNENPFNWSCSTSRQISRWLYESRYLNFDASTLRMAYEHCHGVTPDVSVFEYHNITFEFRSSYSFNRVWRF